MFAEAFASPAMFGLLYSFSNSVVVACIGYYTVFFHTPSFFFQVMVCSTLAPATILFLTKFDSTFDKVFSSERSDVFRLYVSLLGLMLSMAALAVSRSRSGVLASASCLGMASAMLNYVGSKLFGAVRTRSLVSLWAASGCGGMACLLLAVASGFHSPGSTESYELFCLLSCGFIAVMSVGVGMWHTAGGLDTVFAHAAAEQLLEKKTDEVAAAAATGYGHYLQFVNLALTVFPQLLLPYWLSPVMAQNLVLWKLGIDLASSGLLACLPTHLPFWIRAGLLAVRSAMLLVAPVLWLQEILAHPAVLIGFWDVFMCLGFLLSGSNDMSGETAGLPNRIRLNRLAHYLGTFLAVTAAGCLIFLVPEGSPLHLSTDSTICTGCAPSQALVAVAPALLCAPPGDAVAGTGLTEVFGYGANLDCRKLSALGIVPARAYPARADGRCLDFVTAPAIGTTLAEPAYATLLPCGGCTSGTVLVLDDAGLSALRESEVGYELATINVTVHGSGAAAGVLRPVVAFEVPAGPLRERRAPSGRYAGLVMCARAALGFGDAQQLACRLTALGAGQPDCAAGAAAYLPLAVTNHTGEGANETEA